MFTLYCGLLSVKKQYVQNNLHTFIKKYFNAKNCWPSSSLQQVVSFLLIDLLNTRLLQPSICLGKKKQTNSICDVQ